MTQDKSTMVTKHVTPTRILIGMMGLCISLMIYSIDAGAGSAKAATDAATAATTAATDAVNDVFQIKTDLKIHEVTQNGSLDKINSGLNTLKQYRGTDRSDQQKFRDEVKAEIKDLRSEIQGLHNLILQGLRQPGSTN